MTNLNDQLQSCTERFAAKMRESGLDPQGPVIADGQFHRFHTGDRKRNQDGWYVLHTRPVPHGAFGCWRDDIHINWSDNQEAIGEVATLNLIAQCEDYAREREKERTDQQEAVAKSVTQEWEAAQSADPNHPYLVKKQVAPIGIKQRGETLLIPLRDGTGKLWNIQYIREDGTKRFKKGGRTKGCYFATGDIQLVVNVAEGYATAASLDEATGTVTVAALSAGNLGPVAEQLREFYPAAEVIICADDDADKAKNTGRDAALSAAKKHQTPIAMPNFGKDRPSGVSDFNDLYRLQGKEAVLVCFAVEQLLQPGDIGDSREYPDEDSNLERLPTGEYGRYLTAEGINEAVRVAERALLNDMVNAREYPIDALGPLAYACKAIAKGAQLDAAIVGQCLLSTASLLTQSFANVQTANGVKPLSLNLLTIAESGEGKSTAESITLAPVSAIQKRDTEIYREKFRDYEIECKRRKKSEQPPEKPTQPYMLMRDATVEGIRRAFVEGRASQGLITSEAAAMLHGYGMSADQKAKTAANLNSLWDAGEVSVARSTGERVQLYHRRLTMHWQIQPSAVGEGLNDALLTEIGLWPRFLVAWPTPAGPRRWAPFDARKHTEIGNYWARCQDLGALPCPDCCDNLDTIYSDEQALAIFAAFFEHMERLAKSKGGKLAEVRIFASRATEQAFRIAGVLVAYAALPEIDETIAKHAVRLVEYSIYTWAAIHGGRSDNEDRYRATKLYRWLLKQRNQRSDTTAILRTGPRGLRNAACRDAALSILKRYGLIRTDYKTVQAMVAHEEANVSHVECDDGSG